MGSIIVFSSGNYNQDFAGVAFPANVAGVIAVGAVNKSGTVWNYSSKGNELGVVAPSGGTNGDVVTTDRMGANGYDTGNYTTTFNGTSAACPQVAGIASLIISVRPDLRQDQVRQAIESTCTKLSGYSYSNNSAHPNGTWNNEVGHGLVNAYEAVYSVAPRISGPSAVCVASSGTFTAQNFPGTVTWTCSPNLILSVNGNTATVTNDDGGLFHFNSSVQPDDQPKAIPPALTLNSPPTGWIRAEVAGTSIVAEKTITTNMVGISSFVGLTVELSLDGYSQASFRAQTSIPANVSWSVTPSNGIILTKLNDSDCLLDFTQRPTSYTLTATTNNECGTYSFSRTFDSSCPTCPQIAYGSINYSIFPNPVSDILNIEIDEDAVAAIKSQAIMKNKTINNPTFDILLYDELGVIQQQTTTKGGKIEFNVSNLPNGNYYLHIYDGVNDKPEMQQIIIRH